MDDVKELRERLVETYPFRLRRDDCAALFTLIEGERDYLEISDPKKAETLGRVLAALGSAMETTSAAHLGRIFTCPRCGKQRAIHPSTEAGYAILEADGSVTEHSGDACSGCGWTPAKEM